MNNNQKEAVERLKKIYYENCLEMVDTYGSCFFHVYESDNGNVIVFSRADYLNPEMTGVERNFKLVEVDKAGFEKDLDEVYKEFYEKHDFVKNLKLIN